MTKFLKYTFLLFVVTIISCTDKDTHSTITWVEVMQKGNEYVIVDCNYHNQSIKVNEKELIDVGTMEEAVYKIDHTQETDKGFTYFFNKEESSFYKYEWIDQEKGLAKWTIKYPGDQNALTRFYCDSLQISKYKIVKGEGDDCITDAEIEEPVKIDGGADQDSWLGEYRLTREFSRQDSEDTVTVRLEIKRDKAVIKTTANKIDLPIFQKDYIISNDSLIIRFNKKMDYYEDEYILIKNEKGYTIAGLSIYMLNPPNPEYPIKKLK